MNNKITKKDIHLAIETEAADLGQYAYPLLSAYPTKNDMLKNIWANNEKKPVTVSLKQLSANGMAKRDSKKVYRLNKALSSSDIKAALVSPRAFLYNYEEATQGAQKPYFELGKFAHMAFIEPHRFALAKVEPDVNRSTKEGVATLINYYRNALSLPATNLSDWGMSELKAEKERLYAECHKHDIQFVPASTHRIIKALEKNYHSYGGGIIKHILKGATTGVSFYGTDAATGLSIRTRPDYFNIKENIGVDAIISLKTTHANNIERFVKECTKWQYDLSEGMYQETMSHITGRPFNCTIMIMLQTVPPYDVAILWWSPEMLQEGKCKYHYALSIIKDCIDKKHFPGYDAKAEIGAYGIIDM